jgi:hypothetical protein
VTHFVVLRVDLEVWVLEKLRRYDEEPGFEENRNRKFIDKQGYENHLRDHSQAKFRGEIRTCTCLVESLLSW